MAIFNFGWAPQKFGARRDKKRRHAGVDLGVAGKKGIPIGCPIDGFKVMSVKRRSGYGNTVDLISADGTKMMRFAHIADPLPKHLKVGQTIRQGDWLGDVGGTGRKPAYKLHLHFEYRIKKGNAFVPVNPFGNKYHTFSQRDFETSTRMAYLSRKAVRLGKAPVSYQDIAFNEKENARNKNQTLNANGINKTNSQEELSVKNEEYQNVWTLNRGFGAPNWWERNMPAFLGGWSKERLAEAERQRKLDEEVFKGIKRRDLIEKGLSNTEIETFRTYVEEKTRTGDLQKTLKGNSYVINVNDVYDDRQTADRVHKVFSQINKDQGLV